MKDISKADSIVRVLFQEYADGTHRYDFDGDRCNYSHVEKGIEIFNSFNVQSSVLRALIESPLILRMLTDTEAGLYEATLLNSRYSGRELHTLPFVNKITISRIFRNRKPIDPHGDTVLEYGDHILFTGDRQAAEEVRENLQGRK